MTLGIPKRLGHIWIGPLEPPLAWMETWRSHHPDWDYTLYDNATLTGRRWRSQRQITEYFRRGRFEGVADLMRYELLLENGGVIADADSICLRPTDELWQEPHLYACYEHETLKPGNVSPFIASAPGHPFLERVVERLSHMKLFNLKDPWQTTGNMFLRRYIAKHSPERITFFPHHYFNPTFKNRIPYEGDGPVYADQKWGTTTGSYAEVCAPTSAEERGERHAAVLSALESHL